MNAPAPHHDPARTAPVELATGKLGMRLLIASLAVLFASTITGYLVVRTRAEVWPPVGMPSLPSGLWLSTVLIVLSSLTIQWAVAGIRRDRQQPLRLGLLATLVLGLAFLASQTVNWFGLVAADVRPGANLYAFTFFVLTWLHALHVVGGLVPLAVVTTRAWRGGYSAGFHPGVEYTAMYWHFLDVVWLILFAVLYLGS
ncbi:MAG: heme-copper oxidase subunit [Acidobacteria bacterium]|nr:heme-copper oxidase subunit [Acidobacteriota bacterium]